MALLDAIAIGAAAQIRRTAGARAGIIAYKNLLQSATEETRAHAILGGIECAIDASDEHAAFTFAEQWVFVTQGSWERAVVSRLKLLGRKKYLRPAHVLAEIEHKRAPRPFIAYALARICEARDLDADAQIAWASCASFESAKDARAVVTRAALEIASLRARAPETQDAALVLARKIDASALRDLQKVHLACILLLSPSRFERASALSTLCDLARKDPAVRATAIRRAAAHADRLGSALTPLEADRVAAAIAIWPLEKNRAVAAARLAATTRSDESARSEAQYGEDPETRALLQKGRAVLAGALGPDLTSNMQSTPNARATELALTALAHARRGAAQASHLAAVTRALDPKARTPRAVFTLALAALCSSNASLHAEGATLAKHALAHAVSSPRGLVALADALAARGRDDLAEHALHLAETAREDEATARLVVLNKRRARLEAAAGHSKKARALLIEARRRARP